MQDDVPSQVNAWKSQIKKGTLELAILALLDTRRFYGLELLQQLNALDLEIGEGSIYPVLARLRNEKKVTTEWVDESAGHSHKYYTLTPFGRQILRRMVTAWNEYTNAINGAISKVHPHE